MEPRYCFVLSAAVLSAALLSTSGCGQPVPDATPAQAPRPVKVQILRLSDPSIAMRKTGVVAVWNEEKVGFEVAGRVQHVVEEAQDVAGPVWNADGAIVHPGTLLARLDTTTYALRVAEAEAQIAVLEAQQQQLQTEIDELLPEQEREARANFTFAEKNLKRNEALRDSPAFRAIELDEAQANFAAARARLAQIEATRKVRQANIRAILAQVGQQREAVKQARLDVKRCELRAPFSGRVSRTHVVTGGVVQPGAPVVTLTVMDPIVVELAVSPETDRDIKLFEQVRIYPIGQAEPQPGWVETKSTTADPNTRTFAVRILTRNFKRAFDLPPDAGDRQLPRIALLMPMVKIAPESADVFITEGSLHRDAEGWFLWRANAKISDEFQTVLTLRKQRVVPGDLIHDLLGIYRFRLLKEAEGGLETSFNAQWLYASGASGDLTDGARVLYTREDWLFKPGAPVHVELPTAKLPSGFYVPPHAVVEEEGRHFVFLAEGFSEETVARRIPVTLGNRTGPRWRIEGEGCAEGARLVVDGVHFLRPDERVRVAEVLKPQ